MGLFVVLSVTCLVVASSVRGELQAKVIPAKDGDSREFQRVAARFVCHRGESKDAPENTMPAFRLAQENGNYGFECDVYLTKAEKLLVVNHDNTFARTGGLDKRVVDTTKAELDKLDVGAWKGPQWKGTKVCYLADVLSLAKDGCVIYVEVKGGAEMVPYLKEAFRKEPKATPARALFIAFNREAVAALRAQMPEYRAYWLSGLKMGPKGVPSPTAAEVVAVLRQTKATGVDIQNCRPALTPDYIQTVKKAGFEFHVWTENNAAAAYSYFLQDVDTVTTDCGKRLTDQISQMRYNKRDCEKEFGFLPATLLLSSDGAETCADTKVRDGAYNLQVNRSHLNGGIVTLNPQNRYTGCTYVKSGTAVVTSIADAGKPCSLGAKKEIANNIVLGNGTLAYTGPAATTDRGILILSSDVLGTVPSVIRVDKALTLTGPIDCSMGCLAKTGAGTLTIARPGRGVNRFATDTKEYANGLNPPTLLRTNGDSPSQGFSSFNVFDGTFVIATADTVTNYFGTQEFCVGKNTTVEPGKETAGRVEIRGGYNLLGTFLAIGRYNGTTFTAPKGVSSVVTVSGGETHVQNLSMGYTTYQNDCTARPAFYQTGGRFFVDLLRPSDHDGCRTRLGISGGTFTANTMVGALQGSGHCDLFIEKSGTMCVKRAMNLAGKDDGSARVYLRDGGTLQAGNIFCGPRATAVIYADGGIWEATDKNSSIKKGVDLYVGEKGLTILLAGNHVTIGGDLLRDPQLLGKDGGIQIKGKGTVTFNGKNTLAGPVVAPEAKLIGLTK